MGRSRRRARPDFSARAARLPKHRPHRQPFRHDGKSLRREGSEYSSGAGPRIQPCRVRRRADLGHNRCGSECHPGLSDIQVLDPVDDIDEVFTQTRVALVPSLWAEARSRIILEAMVRGIPVLASNVGGLAEAMLGMDYLLPVNPVTRYHASMDELM